MGWRKATPEDHINIADKQQRIMTRNLRDKEVESMPKSRDELKSEVKSIPVSVRINDVYKMDDCLLMTVESFVPGDMIESKLTGSKYKYKGISAADKNMAIFEMDEENVYFSVMYMIRDFEKIENKDKKDSTRVVEIDGVKQYFYKDIMDVERSYIRESVQDFRPGDILVEKNKEFINFMFCGVDPLDANSIVVLLENNNDTSKNGYYCWSRRDLLKYFEPQVVEYSQKNVTFIDDGYNDQYAPLPFYKFKPEDKVILDSEREYEYCGILVSDPNKVVFKRKDKIYFVPKKEKVLRMVDALDEKEAAGK